MTMTTSVTDALSGLDVVPWHDLKHAFGPATDVPDLLRALASQDGKLREKTWYTLHGNLWHQGTIYQATTHAVPFFIRLLEAESVQEKHQILLYLALLFSGRSALDMHRNSTVRAQADFESKLKAELESVAATRAAICSGREIYVQQLHGDAMEPRIAAAYLLGLVGEIDDAEERELTILEEVAKSCES